MSAPRFGSRRAAFAAGLLYGLLAAAVKADVPKQPTPRASETSVATCGPVAGVLVERAEPGAPWHFLSKDDLVRPEILLVALPDAELYTVNGNVQLNLVADTGKRGPLPVYESAVRLHANPKVDLDFTLDRGIVTFANRKKAGAADVRVRFAEQDWTLTLREPGTMVGMEIYGRHPPGAPRFVQAGDKVKVEDPPTIVLILGVGKGRVTLRAGSQEVALDAPPGPAKLHWDSVAKQVVVSHLDKLPPSLKPATPAERKQYQELCTNLRRLRDGPLDTVLEKALESEDVLAHRGGVVILGALDKLPRLVQVLATSKYPESRDKSIAVLRNWLGRGPGQVEKLYAYLTAERKLSPARAKTAIHLLYGFDEDERRRPDTYELLIDCLKHSQLAVRELARWHLVRLAPEGKTIGYDAGAPPEQRERAYAQWRALVPPGQLPPHLRAQSVGKK